MLYLEFIEDNRVEEKILMRWYDEKIETTEKLFNATREENEIWLKWKKEMLKNVDFE